MEHQEMLAEIARAFKFCKRFAFQHIWDPALAYPTAYSKMWSEQTRSI